MSDLRKGLKGGRGGLPSCRKIREGGQDGDPGLFRRSDRRSQRLIAMRPFPRTLLNY